MRSFLTILLYFALSCAVGAPAQMLQSISNSKGASAVQSWTLVHETYCSTSHCTGGGSALASTAPHVTIPSTASGNVLVVWIATTNGVQVKITSVTDSGDTFVAPGATCQAFTSGAGSVDGAYSLASAGGKTSVIINVSPAASSFVAVHIMEWQPAIPATFDGCKAASDSASTSPPIPSALSVTGTDVITQVALPTNSITAIAAPYTANATALSDGYGAARAANVTSYSVINWTQDVSGTVSVGAMSIK